MGHEKHGERTTEFNPNKNANQLLHTIITQKQTGTTVISREMLRVYLGNQKDKKESIQCLLSILGAVDALVPRYQFKELLQNNSPVSEGWIVVFYDTEEEEDIELWVKQHVGTITLIRDRVVTHFRHLHRNNSLQIAIWYLNEAEIKIDKYETKVYKKCMMASRKS